MPDVSGTGDPTETLEMDWSQSLQSTYMTSLNLELRGFWKRKRGRPRNTWRRDLEANVKDTGCLYIKHLFALNMVAANFVLF